MKFHFNKCISDFKKYWISFYVFYSSISELTFRSEFQRQYTQGTFLFLVYEIAIVMKYLLAFPLLVALWSAIYKGSYTDIHWLCKRGWIILAILFLNLVLKSANK